MRQLNQQDPGLARAYHASLGAEKIRLARMLTVLAGGLNLAFMLLDYWAIPSAISTVWMIRALMIGVIAIALASTWHPKFLHYYSAIMVTTIVVIGLGVNAMVLLAASTDVARDHYYGGLLLITFGLYALTYISLPISIAISVLFIGCYWSTSSGLPKETLATSLFFFVSTTIIGMVALSVRERYSRESFLLRHALQEDVLRKHEEAKRSAHLAEHDALTGLPNRLRFFKEAEHLLTLAESTDAEVAILFIDLNGFKPINDRHGHAVGDRVLTVIAQRLRECLRTEDIVARLGGDEFVVCLIIEDAKPATVQAIVRHITHRLQEEIVTRQDTLTITASIGVAIYPEDGVNLKTLLQRADEDMYRIKSEHSRYVGAYD
ncbi:MAG: diguanylate cyclase domain-containing protein [Pseudomonadales bacterium]